MALLDGMGFGWMDLTDWYSLAFEDSDSSRIECEISRLLCSLKLLAD